jgi:hypothetical protein|tara:strand:+ start:62 stop:301 length:240 start_codon:yes stop_codon:yes gene_type:complete
MNGLERTLRLAKEAEPMSREQYSYESWALGTIKAMVSIWADDYHRGEPLKGHDRVRWVKDVYARIQELDKILNPREDKK